MWNSSVLVVDYADEGRRAAGKMAEIIYIQIIQNEMHQRGDGDA